MEKDIEKIPKNPDTDIVIRIDDFGGNVGLTIREFIRSERYTGFTKAGTRVPASQFKAFKEAINSIDEEEIVRLAEEAKQTQPKTQERKFGDKSQETLSNSKSKSNKSEKTKENYEEMTM